MIPSRKIFFLFLFSLWQLPVTQAQDKELPVLEHRVTDLSELLSEDEKSYFESKLADFEARKGSQIALVIIPSTGDESIEQYSIRLVEHWKIGREGVDDGVILLVARHDRKLRIEVGYGLEGAIPDAAAARIIDEYIVPKFKNGDYYGGIDAGLNKIIGLIEGEALPKPEVYTASGSQPFYSRLIFGQLLLGMSFIGVLGMVLMAKAKKKTFGRYSFGFLAVSLLGGFLSFSLATGLFMAIFGIIIGLFMRVIFNVSKKRGGTGRWRSSSYSSSWRSSSSSSSWSSGSSFGGGSSFSGGGGSFGGGGASGSW